MTYTTTLVVPARLRAMRCWRASRENLPCTIRMQARLQHQLRRTAHRLEQP